MVRLLVVDHHRLLREAIVAELSRCEGVEAVFEAGSAGGATRVFDRERPDVVVVTIQTPGGDSFGAVRALRAIDPYCRVVVVSASDSDATLAEALDLDAAGYLLTQDGLAALGQAIRAVARGGRYFSEAVSDRLGVEKGRIQLVRPRSAAIAALTNRERELLRLLGRGASLKQAAVAMEVSYKTADNHKASLMRKLGIHDRVELARFAIREGWVSAG